MVFLWAVAGRLLKGHFSAAEEAQDLGSLDSGIAFLHSPSSRGNARKVKADSGIDGISSGTCLRRDRRIDLSLSTPFTQLCAVFVPPLQSPLWILFSPKPTAKGTELFRALLPFQFSLCAFYVPPLLSLFLWLK